MLDVADGRLGVVLGTAGHIDHGKTALVHALTGTDTDRLAEEKARGITIELGFAELVTEGGYRFGVVDVPGHEAFVRAMVAGAAGMDVVLLVVGADEGVMPQTREHLAIVELLDVPELVVALTKADLVDPEWLELVHLDVEETLAATRFAGAPRVATSSRDGTGLDELRAVLDEAAARVEARAENDLVRLPLDRVFTIQGTGTVVTGTMWSGSLETGASVRILPERLDARVRGVQLHGREAELASAGDRTAVALTGDGADRARVDRGATLVTSTAWEPSHMLTTRVRVLPDVAWSIAHNQRVHVHLGTAQVLARCALLESAPIEPGGSGWVQLRLESPLVARGGDRLVVRAYSPVTTIGGGVVAEPHPPKRHRLDDDTRRHLEQMIGGDPDAVVSACLESAGWMGRRRDRLPIDTGLVPAEIDGCLDQGAGVTSGRLVFAPQVVTEAGAMLLQAVEQGHRADPLAATLSLAAVRSALPSWTPSELVDAALDALIADGRLEASEGGVRTPSHRAEPTDEQAAAIESLRRAWLDPGLAPPPVEELPAELREREDFWSLVRWLEGRDVIRHLGEGFYLSGEALDLAAERVREALGGKSGLGPAEFREVVPVTRKHLIPILNYFDGLGVTVRDGGGRAVPGV